MVRTKYLLIVAFFLSCNLKPEKKKTIIQANKINGTELLSFVFKNKLDSIFYRGQQYIFAKNSKLDITDLRSKINNYPIFYVDTLVANTILKKDSLYKKFQLLFINVISKENEINLFITEWDRAMVYRYTFEIDSNRIKYVKYDIINPKFGYPLPFNNKHKKL